MATDNKTNEAKHDTGADALSEELEVIRVGGEVVRMSELRVGDEFTMDSRPHTTMKVIENPVEHEHGIWSVESVLTNMRLCNDEALTIRVGEDGVLNALVGEMARHSEPLVVFAALSNYQYDVSPGERAQKLFDHFGGACMELDGLVRMMAKGTSLCNGLPFPTAKVYLEHAMAHSGSHAVRWVHAQRSVDAEGVLKRARDKA